ncbi:NAD(P)-dependent dehydrogenase (short-subunit alcohol dehydrogenase family) [Oxalobacteraceae bacterium GrIS 2.11]
MNEWHDKTILITGAAGGLGFAVTQRFLAAGANVMLADLSAERLAAVVQQLDAKRCGTSTINLTSVSDCERMVSETIDRFGRIDVLINCAGIWVEGAADKMTEADWDKCVDVNLKGLFFCCRYAIPHLEKTGGSIVNISSDAGLQGNANASIYCASKGGVVILTKALALELAPRGIRVNAVCPCDIQTPMIEYQAKTYGGDDIDGYYRNLLANYPQGSQARFAQADEIAAFIFAISSPKLVPLTGAALAIDFGMTAGHT